MKFLRIILALAFATPAFSQKESLQRAVGTNTVTGSLASSPFQVQSIAALSAISTAILYSGQQVSVSQSADSIAAVYSYNASSSASADGRNVIAPNSGSGRWLLVSPLGALPADITNGENIAAWGDSLTAGSGGTPYPTQLATGTGYTVYNGGVGGETSTQIKVRMLAATSRYPNLVVIWAGRNNYTQTATVLADVAAMISVLGHDRYLVLSVLNGDYAYEYQGAEGYNYIITLNNALAAAYGVHYVDVRAYLVSLYNPAVPQDVIDHSHDVPPSTLRSDQIHLNTAGYGDVVTDILSNVVSLEGTPQAFIASSRIMDLFRSPPPIGRTTPGIASFSTVTAPVVFLQETGTSRFISLSGDGSSFQFNGKVIPLTDATYDLGYSNAALRWRDLNVSRDANIGGNVNATNLLGIGSFTGVASTPAITAKSSSTAQAGGIMLINSSAASEKWRFGLRDMGSGSEGNDLIFGYFNGVSRANNLRLIAAGGIQLSDGPSVLYGAGSPEGSVTASPGSIYLNTSGGASTTLYVKETGSGNTGWIAK